MSARILTAISAVVLVVTFTGSALAASPETIDRRVENALTEFYAKVNGGEDLVRRASGVLVFPKVGKGGIGVGFEYGQGALLIDGKIVDYYSTTAASIGFQLGGQVRKEIILFMNDEALQKFRLSKGWEVGVDGSVALITLGAGGEIDTTELNEPVIGFIFSNKGLMYNLSFEGAKITKLDKKPQPEQ